MANVLERACPLCLGVYLADEMLEFSIDEQATKSRRTLQICGTCAGNIADAVYNHLTADEKEAKRDDAIHDRDSARDPVLADSDSTNRPVVLQNQPGSEGSGVDSGEPRAAAGGEGASQPPESAAPAGGIEQSTAVEK